MKLSTNLINQLLREKLIKLNLTLNVQHMIAVHIHIETLKYLEIADFFILNLVNCKPVQDKFEGKKVLVLINLEKKWINRLFIYLYFSILFIEIRIGVCLWIYVFIYIGKI